MTSPSRRLGGALIEGLKGLLRVGGHIVEGQSNVRRTTGVNAVARGNFTLPPALPQHLDLKLCRAAVWSRREGDGED
jgi:hypothetical protein